MLQCDFISWFSIQRIEVCPLNCWNKRRIIHRFVYCYTTTGGPTDNVITSVYLTLLLHFPWQQVWTTNKLRLLPQTHKKWQHYKLDPELHINNALADQSATRMYWKMYILKNAALNKLNFLIAENWKLLMWLPVLNKKLYLIKNCVKIKCAKQGVPTFNIATAIMHTMLLYYNAIVLCVPRPSHYTEAWL